MEVRGGAIIYITTGHLRVTMAMVTMGHLFIFLFVKLREREGQGVDPGKSLKGHL